MGRLRPRWRKMTWVIVAWTVIFAFWIGAAINNASNHTHAYCLQHHGVLSVSTCEQASNTGTGIGVFLLASLWVVGFIVLSLVWFMTRSKGRACPVCGNDVRKGLTTCQRCGHDFASARSAYQPSAAVVTAEAVPPTPVHGDSRSSDPPSPGRPHLPTPRASAGSPVVVSVSTPSTASDVEEFGVFCTACAQSFNDPDARFCSLCGAPRFRLTDG
jgi:hypothetical protein